MTTFFVRGCNFRPAKPVIRASGRVWSCLVSARATQPSPFACASPQPSTSTPLSTGSAPPTAWDFSSASCILKQTCRCCRFLLLLVPPPTGRGTHSVAVVFAVAILPVPAPASAPGSRAGVISSRPPLGLILCQSAASAQNPLEQRPTLVSIAHRPSPNAKQRSLLLLLRLH